MTAQAAGWAPRGLGVGWTGAVAQATSEAGSDRTAPQDEDRALVEACIAGQRDAFDQLVERHRRAVYQLCYRFAGNHEDASDLAQEVFVRAYRGLGRFERRASFSTWLHRIALNVCLDRVSSRRPPHAPLDEVAREANRARDDDPAEALLRAERIARVRAAIARLPRKQRTTLILRMYRELSHEEIARILGSSVGAAKANLFHALANLKKLLERGV